MKIGLTYVKGAVPGLENFGFLPTHLIKSNGLIEGNPISEELDGLIIPGGSILESKSISDDFKDELKLMAREGKPIIGICAGYQFLSNGLDTTNPNLPIDSNNSFKEGLGILDVNFSYLFSNDKVESKVACDSFLTKGLDTIKGFHCHSYGGISGNAKTLFYSPLRVNYSNKFQDIVSGSISDDGNVIGTMIHNLLDDNPQLVSNFFNFIDASEEDIFDIYKQNKILQYNMKKEIGIDTNILLDSSLYNIQKSSLISIKEDEIQGKLDNKKNSQDNFKSLIKPKVLMIASTESKSGKTFITAGIAGILMNYGLNVGVLKLGSNIKDILPALYLTKSNMEDYSLIKTEVEDSFNSEDIFGWNDIREVLDKINNSNYDIVLIEGEKAIFDNLTNPDFYSTVEIILSSDIPFLLVSNGKYGIDYSISDLLEHEKILYSLGLSIDAVIVNNILEEDFNSLKDLKSYFSKQTDIDNVFTIPNVDYNNILSIEKSLVELQNRYDLYSLLAYYTVNENINPLDLLNIAKKVSFKKYYSLDELEFLNKFLS